MKKIIFLGLALLGLAAFTQAAALSTAGSINTPLVDQDGDGKLVLRVFQVNPSGTPIATPAAAPGIIAGFTPTVYVNVLSVPTPTPGIQPISITAQSGYTRLTATAYTGVTTNATVSLGLTATAGTSAYKSLIVKLWVKSGVTAVNATIHATSTPPATFAAGTGPEFFPSDNLKTVGLPVNISDGNVYYFSFVASALSGATSGTVWYEIWGQ